MEPNGVGLYGNNPLMAIMQAMSQVGHPGMAGQPIDYSQPSTMQNNPLIGNAMASLGAMGGAPGAMMGAAASPMGSPLGNGFTLTSHSLSVQPGNDSATKRFQNMTKRRTQQVQGRQANALRRRRAGTLDQQPNFGNVA